VTGDERARPLQYVDIGAGPTIVLLHGYGMQPVTYLPMARLLADRARVVIPNLLALPERWTFEHALDCLELTLDEIGVDQVSLLGELLDATTSAGREIATPGRPVAIISNVQIEYRPAPVKPARR